MPIASLLALTIAVALGFILGLLEALDRLTYRQTLHVAEVGVAIVLFVAVAGVVRERGRVGERLFVLLLRAGLGGTLFAFIFEGMRLLLKVGNVGGAVASWLWAGVLALLLARLTPRAGRVRT